MTVRSLTCALNEKRIYAPAQLTLALDQVLFVFHADGVVALASVLGNVKPRF